MRQAPCAARAGRTLQNYDPPGFRVPTQFVENATKISANRLGHVQLPPGRCCNGRADANRGNLVKVGGIHMSSVDLDERRRSPRHRLGRLGTMKLGIGIPPRYVLITNTSAEGVRLQLNGIDVLDEFVLLFHGSGGPARDGTYKVVWRQGQDVGAKFISGVTENA
jgi:hypothetical protein